MYKPFNSEKTYICKVNLKQIKKFKKFVYLKLILGYTMWLGFNSKFIWVKKIKRETLYKSHDI